MSIDLKKMPKLGFGLMRLPQTEDKKIDIEQTKQMVDMFMDAGFTYFDTAWAYEGSEDAIRQNRLHFGLVFQNFNLFPQYTVLGNVTLAPTLLNKGNPEQIREKALSLLEQVKRMNIDQILALIDVVFPLVTTDMTNAEIVSAAISFFPLLQEIKVTTQYIPAEGTYHATFVRGMSVLIPDFEANRKILQDTLK